MATSSEGLSARADTTAFVGLGLCLLLLLHLAVNLWWMRRDNLPQVGDTAVHIAQAQIYYRVLTNPDEPSFIKRVAAMRHVPLGWYPPVVHVLGAFSALLFGDEKSSYVLVDTVTFLALITAVYFLARSMFPPGLALYAAAAVSLTPFLVGMSRLFLLDLLSALVVVLAYIAIVKSDSFRRPMWIAALALLTAFGFWVRWTTPLYYALPILWVIAIGFGRKSQAPSRWSRSTVVGFIVLGAVSVSAVGAWFVRSGIDLREIYEQSYAPMQQDVPLSQGETWLAYPLIVINSGVFLPTAILAAIGAIVSLMQIRNRGTALLFMAWVVTSILVLTLLIPIRNPAPRYVIPALVPVGLLAVVAVTAIRNAPLRKMTMSGYLLLLVFQFVNVTAAPFGRYGTLAFDVPRPFEWPRHVANQDLVVFTDRVNASGAKYGPPYRGENWIETALGAIAEADSTPHPIVDQDAKYLLIGTQRSAVAGVQRDYWPKDPPHSGHAVRRVPGYYVEVSGTHTVDYVDGRSGRAESVQLEKAEGLRVALFSQIRVSGESIAGLAGLSLALEPRSPVLVGYTVSISNDGGKTLDSIVEVNSNWQRFIFHAFEPVSADVLTIDINSISEGADFRIAQLELYTRIPQPRPLILTGFLTNDSVDAMKPEWVDVAEYAIWVRARGESANSLAASFPGFELMRSFDAMLSGYWEPRTFHVLRKPPREVITFESCPTLDVQVSFDNYPEGRWDLPWWRYNWWTGVSNPSRMEYWSAPAPATMEADFGALYEVDGIEIVPYSLETGIPEVRVEYQAEGGAWLGLAPELIHVSRPLFEGGKRVVFHREYPEKWDAPTTMRAVRLSFSGQERVYISNVFVFGKRGFTTDEHR